MLQCPVRAGRNRWRNMLCASMGLVLVIASSGTDCAGNTTGDPAVFPANYRSTYTLVRDCRLSSEHGGDQIRVWVNDIGAQAYLDEEDTLPVGTIVVKEEFAGLDCDNDSELVLWAVMRKEAAGFDPNTNDWEFYEYNAPSRTRTATPREICIACHEVPECVDRDYMCAEGP